MKQVCIPCLYFSCVLTEDVCLSLNYLRTCSLRVPFLCVAFSLEVVTWIYIVMIAIFDVRCLGHYFSYSSGSLFMLWDHKSTWQYLTLWFTVISFLPIFYIFKQGVSNRLTHFFLCILFQATFQNVLIVCIIYFVLFLNTIYFYDTINNNIHVNQTLCI